MNRRTILKYGLGGAALLAAGGVGLALRSTVERKPMEPLRALDARTFSILAAVAERITPAENGFPSALELRVPEKIDGLLAGDPAQAAEVRQVLLLLENALAGFVLDRRVRTFTSSTPEEQDGILDAWRTSRIDLRRTAYLALQGLCAAAYYASPEIYPLVGYPGPPDYGNVRKVAAP